MKTTKKFLVGISMLAMAIASTGCHTVTADLYKADTDAEMVPAKFKPTVEVMKDKGLVTGSARSAYAFWIIPTEYPNKFSTIKGSFGLPYSLANAAMYDACQKSGASILLAPRFTVKRYTSFLWFMGDTEVTVTGIPAKIKGAEEIPVESWPTLFGPQSGTQKIIQYSK